MEGCCPCQRGFPAPSTTKSQKAPASHFENLIHFPRLGLTSLAPQRSCKVLQRQNLKQGHPLLWAVEWGWKYTEEQEGEASDRPFLTPPDICTSGKTVLHVDRVSSSAGNERATEGEDSGHPALYCFILG